MKEIPNIRMGSSISRNIILPAAMMATVLNALSNTPNDSGRMDSNTSHKANSMQKQIMPIHRENEDNIFFQRCHSLSCSVMAACLNAVCPTVSTTIFSNQTKMARLGKLTTSDQRL